MEPQQTKQRRRRILGAGIAVAAILAAGAIGLIVGSISGNRAAAQTAADGHLENPLRTAVAKPAANAVADTKAADTKTGDAKAADSKAADSKGADSKAGDTNGADTKAGQLPPPAAATGNHPLDAAIKIARRIEKHLQSDVKDYTCTFIKEERINGELVGPQVIAAKIRCKPLSVYFKFLKPDDVKGREVIYVAGANNGKFVVHEGSGLKSALGAIWLKPASALAMAGNRYPITDAGMDHLVKRLIEIAEQDRKYGEVEVHFYKNAKVGKRTCTLIEVVHPTPRRVFLFHIARVYIDNELQVPIHYEAYLWPKAPGQPPPLDESYTYANLKLNVGLTDADFDYKNPNYGFVKK